VDTSPGPTPGTTPEAATPPPPSTTPPETRRSRRRRRPTREPPPLPHHLQTSGVGWLVAATALREALDQRSNGRLRLDPEG
jgi:hypothetical protein